MPGAIARDVDVNIAAQLGDSPGPGVRIDDLPCFCPKARSRLLNEPVVILLNTPNQRFIVTVIQSTTDTRTARANCRNDSCPRSRLGQRMAAVKENIGRAIFGQNDVIEQTLINAILLAATLSWAILAPVRLGWLACSAKFSALKTGASSSRLGSDAARHLGFEVSRGRHGPPVVPVHQGFDLRPASDGRRNSTARFPPRTQSALLQAMQEYRVSIAGLTMTCRNPSTCRHPEPAGTRAPTCSPKPSSTASCRRSTSDILTRTPKAHADRDHRRRRSGRNKC